MVVDLSRVSLGHSIKTGALTVVEQIPGKVMHSDQTQVLRRGRKKAPTLHFFVSLFRYQPVLNVLPLLGYWPSYNIPFHAEIYNLSGYGVMWKRFGEDFSYDLCPRAKILRRDQGKVSDLSSLKHIMRYNSRSNSVFYPLRGNPGCDFRRLLLFQTTRETPTLKAIPVKPSAAATT